MGRRKRHAINEWERTKRDKKVNGSNMHKIYSPLIRVDVRWAKWFSDCEIYNNILYLLT